MRAVPRCQRIRSSWTQTCLIYVSLVSLHLGVWARLQVQSKNCTIKLLLVKYPTCTIGVLLRWPYVVETAFATYWLPYSIWRRGYIATRVRFSFVQPASSLQHFQFVTGSAQNTTRSPWNLLPDELRNVESTESFRNKLKQFCIDSSVNV